MRLLFTLAAICRRLGGDRSGNFAVMMGVVTGVLALSAGFALNTAQLVMTRSNLLAALDSAVTSTARDLTIGSIEAKDARSTVEAFLFANGGTGFASVDRITLDDLVIDKAKSTVSAKASVLVDLAFPLFRIERTQRVTVESAAVYSDKDIEVAMMLDVTGSMSGQKISDLKTAAKNAVETFLKGQKNRTRIRVAIVPYAEAVNTGGLADTVFVEEKGGSDLPPPEDAPIAVSAGSRPDNCATERKTIDGEADFSDDSPYQMRTNKQGKRYPAKVNRDDRISVDGRGNSLCPSARLVPLTADMSRLTDSIDDFRAGGVTAGGIAAQWGYYMLSPNWRQAIVNAGLGSGPANRDDRKVSKIAILMTDGQFNTAFAGVGQRQTPQNRQADKSRRYAERICANMKRDGIEVFTIGFDVAREREAQKVLQNCATTDTSSVKHYYEAADGEQLDWAFQEVARNVERLAITK